MKAFLASLRRALFFRISFLEDEITRLRDENRSLLNAMLTANGLPSLAPRLDTKLPQLKGKLLPSQWRRKMEAAALPKAASNAQG